MKIKLEESDLKTLKEENGGQSACCTAEMTEDNRCLDCLEHSETIQELVEDITNMNTDAWMNQFIKDNLK